MGQIVCNLEKVRQPLALVSWLVLSSQIASGQKRWEPAQQSRTALCFLDRLSFGSTKELKLAVL